MYLICIALASIAVLAQPAVSQGANTTLPLTYPGQVLQGDGSWTCPSENQRERARNEVDNITLSLLQESIVPFLQQNFFCGGSTGWRRVAYLNMSDPSQQCPSVWREIGTPHRVCGRRSTAFASSCEGLNYTTGSGHYDQVCGRIIGYQIGEPEAFWRTSGHSLNRFYVDGISVTHGPPRQHIWTFATGLDEQHPNACPCITGSRQTVGRHIPSFVGQNYFCESGITKWNSTYVFYPNGDPLWDGQGCGPTSSCCTFNSPPWFNIQLPSPTTNDIEVRICSHVGIQREDSPIELMEIYVK